MLHKLACKRFLLLTVGICFLVIVLAAFHPYTSVTEFELTPNPSYKWQEQLSTEVNNCNGEAVKSQVFDVPRSGRSFGAENLRPNGSEPFQSLRQQVVQMFGVSIENITLSAPAGVIREFNLAVSRTIYTGNVEGTVIDTNKILPGIPVTYFYPVVEEVTITQYHDIQCEE
jgi:hypothetical protein